MLTRGEKDMAALQEADLFLKPIRERLRNPDGTATRKIKRAARAFTLIENVMH